MAGGQMKAAVIGNGSMVLDCLKIISESGDIDVGPVVGNSTEASNPERVINYCANNNIEYIDTKNINDKNILDKIESYKPDYIFNINSYMIIGDPLLGMPANGIINFHNGPLPRYGGLNVCSWAIINGETEYGVTWHFVDKDIDAGDIIACRSFSVRPDETALSLIMRCISEGTQMFKSVVADIDKGVVGRQPQDRRAASYYSGRDLPFAGLFPFDRSSEALDRLRRGISFHPIHNNFFFPRCAVNGRSFGVEDFDLKAGARSDKSPGTVLAVGEDGIDVATADAVITLTSVVDDKDNTVALVDIVSSYGISTSSVMTGAD